jgi:hypothetical protein
VQPRTVSAICVSDAPAVGSTAMPIGTEGSAPPHGRGGAIGVRSAR